MEETMYATVEQHNHGIEKNTVLFVSTQENTFGKG